MGVKKVTFDDVRAGLDRLEKTVAETQKQVDETSRIVGNLGSSFTEW